MVPLPPGKVPVSCRWIYKIKTHSYESIERYKVHLIAHGFTQGYDIGNEIFAPIIKMTSVPILIALVVTRDWPLYQLDVKNVFLHENLQEEVYIETP